MIFILCLIMSTSEMTAQKLIIKMNNGVENNETLNTLQKLYFSDNQLIVDFKSGSDDIYYLSDIRKLYFDAEVSVDDNSMPEIPVLSVFPNPAGNFITVRDIPVDASSIFIYSIDGGLALTRTASSSLDKIDISRLPNGLYLVNVSGYTTKFVKK
jgi:hypothetical protein